MLVPGTRPGVISRDVAEALPATVRVVAPAANVPYTRPGAEVLHRRGILALPDFVCNAGAVIGYRSAPHATPGQVLTDAGDRITALIGEALADPRGPLAGASERAARFLRSWRDDPPGPPFAPSP